MDTKGIIFSHFRANWQKTGPKGKICSWMHCFVVCFVFAVATAAASAVILLLIVVVVCLFVFASSRPWPWETANIVLFGCVDRLLPTPKKSTIISAVKQLRYPVNQLPFSVSDNVLGRIPELFIVLSNQQLIRRKFCLT